MFNICFENNLFVEFFYYKNTVFAHGKGYKLRHEIEFFNVCSRIHKVVTICGGPALTEKKLDKNWNVNEYLSLGWSESHI